MCSKEEVQKIVNDSENKMELKLYEQQVELSKTVSNLLGDVKKDIAEIKTFIKKFEHIEPETLSEISKSYSGLMSFKHFIIGLAVFVASIGAIVGGFIAIIKSVK